MPTAEYWKVCAIEEPPISAKGTIPVEIKSGIKRKCEEENGEMEDNDFQQAQAKKKLRSTIDALKGLIWDAENYSCAYDALYTILFNIWEFNPSKWNTVLSHLGPFSASLTNGFRDFRAGRIPFESVRDNIRHQVHQASPEHFPYGQNGTDIGDLVRSMFPNLE